jgi:hypothetical protein
MAAVNACASPEPPDVNTGIATTTMWKSAKVVARPIVSGRLERMVRWRAA